MTTTTATATAAVHNYDDIKIVIQPDDQNNYDPGEVERCDHDNQAVLVYNPGGRMHGMPCEWSLTTPDGDDYQWPGDPDVEPALKRAREHIAWRAQDEAREHLKKTDPNKFIGVVEEIAMDLIAVANEEELDLLNPSEKVLEIIKRAPDKTMLIVALATVASELANQDELTISEIDKKIAALREEVQ